MKIVWKLRMAAAQREVWTGAELRRLLADRVEGLFNTLCETLELS
jgi:hypothetical protein